MKKKSDNKALVSVIMGSQSDWNTMKEGCEILEQLKILLKLKLFQLIEHLIDYLIIQKKLKAVELKLL